MRSGQCESEPELNSVSYLTFDTDDGLSASIAGEDRGMVSAIPGRGRIGRRPVRTHRPDGAGMRSRLKVATSETAAPSQYAGG